MKHISIFTIQALILQASIVWGQTIERIEPPNWWVGTNNTRLQIMIYGKGLGDLSVTTKYQGVQILKSENPENDNYLFIDLEIKEKTKPGRIPISLRRDNKEAAKFEYTLLPREPGSAERKGYDSKDVIYLITPDRFANGDTTNDHKEQMAEIPDRTDKNGRHGGDIEGMRKHLDYISGMGFTAVWPTPVIENNMSRYSYHGYAITDFYQCDPRMGTNESYKSFCREANQRGIKVIMDMIHNHCGAGHWWMTDPPSKDWINYTNQPYTETNHRKTIQQDPYSAQEDEAILEDGWFVKTMPDLNVRNPWMATYLIQNSIWWIEFAGLQGIRMDTYLYPDDNYMAEWARKVMAEYPNFNITGEVWYENPAIVSYWQAGKKNADGYVSYLPSVFDFPTQSALRNALLTDEGFNSGWLFLYEMLAQDFQYPAPENLVVFADNHDMIRIFTQLEENIPLWNMAMAYILTIRGIPQVYYGTEILMTSPVNRDDGLIRSDFPGGWNGDSADAFSGRGLSSQQAVAQEFLKKLLKWRLSASAIHHGKTTHFVPQAGVYVYFRYHELQKVMVILNKNENKTTLKLDRYKRVLADATIGTEILTGASVDLTNDILLPGPGPMIIEIRP